MAANRRDDAAPESGRRTPMRIRTHLIILVVGALLPVLAFSAVMTVVSWLLQRATFEQQFLERVRGMTIARDRLLATLVLVDIGLPGFGGYEVARRIRNDGAHEALVLIALTGYGQPEDRRRAMDAGFDAHLVKPVDPPVLADIIPRARPRES